MSKLPSLPFPDSIGRMVQKTFGGYRHERGNFDGTVYDMENLCSDRYPLLSTRKKRVAAGGTDTFYGAFAVGSDLCVADGTALYKNERAVGTVTPGEKTFAALGRRVVVFPDKVYLNLSAKGRYTDLAALASAVPAPAWNDVYAVGAAAPFDLYRWDGASWAFYEKECGTMEPSFTGSVTFRKEGVLFGEEARENAVYALNANWEELFAVGDAVTIRGCTIHGENNKTAVIRGIDGDTLYFYEYCFTVGTEWRYTAEEALIAGDYSFSVQGVNRRFSLVSGLSAGDSLLWDGTSLTATVGGAETPLAVVEGETGIPLAFESCPCDYGEESVTVVREVPDMEHLCAVNNRLWGCKGDTIYGSKLGDPFNFSVFDGVATDSFSVESGSPGEFTACCAYLGYPVFFKEDRVYKVYGAKPAEFSLVASVTRGVAEGSGKSLAVAGETLFYLSPGGIAAYNGGVPTLFYEEFAGMHFHHGVGGGDGRKYFLSVLDEGEHSHLFVYDTVNGLWCREDGTAAKAFWNRENALYMADGEGDIYAVSGELPPGQAEDTVLWMAEFGDFTLNSPDKKWITKVQLRLELGAGAEAQLWFSPDGGLWETVAPLQTADTLRSCCLPLIPRRCDRFRLRLTGKGECALHSLAVEYGTGSEL